MTTFSPWAFHPHPIALAVVVVLGLAYAISLRRYRPTPPRRIAAGMVGLLFLLIALSWPLADMAAHVSLTALVIQRLLFLLAVPPLLTIGTPVPLMSRLTHPPAVDWLVRRCARPSIAVIVVTLIAVATLTTWPVEAQGSSPWARMGLDLALLSAGFVLWAPVLSELPGTDRPSAMGRAGYLIIQSIVPSFLAVIWIFARHPLYAHFAHGPELFGVTPVTDQQVAGFVAKLATIAALWTVAFVSLARAQQATASGRDPDPLLWSDVERHLERVERTQQRHVWPPSSDRTTSTPPQGPSSRPNHET